MVACLRMLAAATKSITHNLITKINHTSVINKQHARTNTLVLLIQLGRKAFVIIPTIGKCFSLSTPLPQLAKLLKQRNLFERKWLSMKKLLCHKVLAYQSGGCGSKFHQVIGFFLLLHFTNRSLQEVYLNLL